MAIQGFDYKEQIIGTGDTSQYTFDFKIFDPSQIHYYLQDNLGNILQEGDGTDASFFSSVVFDPVEGGGTVNLVSFLQNAYVMTLFLANDAPDQPSSFPNKNSFTLEAIESALDYIAAWGQRIAYLAQRAVRLHDLDDIDTFDMRLPYNLFENPLALITINSTGTGFALGPTTTNLNQLVAEAAASAAAAEISETNATASAANALTDSNLAAILANDAEVSANAANASAIAAAASAAAGASGAPVNKTTILEGATGNLAGDSNDHTVNDMVDYFGKIVRGTVVFARTEFTIFYRNGAWELAIGNDRWASSDTGITWAVDSLTGIPNATVASDGRGNAIINLKKIPSVVIP